MLVPPSTVCCYGHLNSYLNSYGDTSGASTIYGIQNAKHLDRCPTGNSVTLPHKVSVSGGVLNPVTTSLVVYRFYFRSLIDHLFKKITDVLPHVDIDSWRFTSMLQEYMLEYTEQFIHEFLSFARSPYDMSQYDE